MSQERHGWSDHEVEAIVGDLLRIGVLLAASVIVLGAVLFLVQDGAKVADHGKFKGEPPGLRRIPDIAAAAFALEGQAVIQFGILLLVATPVARVVFSVAAFAVQRDWFYVLVTLFVLAVLLVSLWDAGP